MGEKQKQTHPEVGEDATQYGEFISTYFAWIPLPDQKENAERMANMTKKAKQNRNQMSKRDKMEPVPNVQKEQNGTGTKCTKEEK